MKKVLLSILICFSTINGIYAESGFSINPGFFLSPLNESDMVSGLGVSVGLEYMKRESSIFSVELRAKYGYYKFDDGTSYTYNSDGTYDPPVNRGEARLDYELSCPQIAIVPKLYLHLGDPFDVEMFSLFLENEFSAGIMTGNFKFKDVSKKKHIADYIFNYNIGLGAEFRWSKYSIACSAIYTTMNFRENIKKHKPLNYDQYIPNQDVAILINAIFKIRI